MLAKNIFLFIPLALLFMAPVNGQEIKKDVTVVTAYKPVVQDFTKISLMPVFNDTFVVAPRFNYTISPIRVDQPFQPRQVSAARMAPEPIKKLYNNYLKLGFGNPYMPLAELSISNGRSKETAIGAFFRHHSASGAIKLNESVKIDAPFADNEIDLYGKRKIKNNVLAANVYYTGNKYTFYGIDTSQINNYNIDNNRQHYQKGGLNIMFCTLETDSNKFIYNLNSGVSYLTDSYENAENTMNINAMGGQNYKDFFVGSQLSIDYFKPGNGNDSLFNSIIGLKPFISKTGAQWRFELALGISFDANKESTKVYSFPSALFEFVVAPSVLKAYVSYSGFLESNNTDKIRLENPYILPGERLKNSVHKSHVTGGLRGNFSSSIEFLANISYSAIENQYFFVFDTLSLLHNHFQAVYDNVDLIKTTGSISYTNQGKAAVSLTANYYNWHTFRQEKAWHKPLFDISLAFRYNLQNKILLTSNWNYTGVRTAKGFANAPDIKLNAFTDINLGIEYRYTKVLSAFIQIRNLTAAKYQVWAQYPAYRFQLMAGFTYSL